MAAQTFQKTDLDKSTKLLTVVRELPADLETPVSIYLRLKDRGPSFLLESVSGGEQIARYSFIGINPSQAFVLRNRTLETISLKDQINICSHKLEKHQDPLDILRANLIKYHQEPMQPLPRFSGGLVGYLSYEIVRNFEPTVPLAQHPDIPEAIFLLADTVIAFDHPYGRMLLITNVQQNNDKFEAHQKACERLDDLERKITSPRPPLHKKPSSTRKTKFRFNMSKSQYMEAVRTIQNHISKGDAFQVVLSQRMFRETNADPFSIYRALRRLNPSPYMFYLDFASLAGDEPFQLIGASPEMHTRFEHGIASLRPIAGTRPRGNTPEIDSTLETELLADPKERAEHVMLVDLARNDLGRVCKFASIHVPEKMIVERYSHVMHIVSHVEGELRPDVDAFDLMRATFPAGTVTGAPKIRAMQIIGELESEPRGPYAGTVGYFSFDGSSDTCITIRTLTLYGRTVSIQSGAGIVADSKPSREYEETLSKAKVLSSAIELAEKGL